MVDFFMNHVWLIPLFPLIAFTLIVFVFYKMPKISATVGITAILSSFVMALFVGYGVLQHPEFAEHARQYGATWFEVGSLKVQMGVRLDGMTAMMLFVVSLVASLVQIYSLGYMHGDKGISRFYAYLSLFAMSMLGLVIAPNLLQMFVFWELVGLCSYLLIGFWFHKYSAREAAKKAFITTRTGDFGLLLGILIIQFKFGTLDFTQLAKVITPESLSASGIALFGVLALLFIGPIGKSGQFPLHVWLPDAMEGPTPVSALIHAATMVVAGVYLTGRMLFAFKAVPSAMLLVAIFGAFTALFAATIAITQVEMKKILAYSTVSQLGYMMLALGAGSLTASMFHLMTHAFFKALMFLGAGSVLHAMHDEANIWKYGGLRKKMPITAYTFLIGCLAIAGIFPFAGFFSKDQILEVVYAASSMGHSASQYPVVYTVLFWMAAITAGLTAFYMFRMFFICFTGDEKEENHPHESPFTMTMPLVVLGVLSVVGGWVGWPTLAEGHSFSSFVRLGEFEPGHWNWFLVILSSALALAGITLAYVIYSRKSISHEALANKYKPVYTLLYNKYYIDEIYLWLINNVLGGLSKLLYWVDIYIVDGIINGLGAATKILADTFRYVQTGRLQTYGLIMFLAVVVIVIIMYFSGDSNASTVAALLLGGGK